MIVNGGIFVALNNEIKMTFKEKLTTAKARHYIETREKIRNSYISSKLFPNSTLNARRSSMSNYNRNDFDLRSSQIKILMKIFPETDERFWIQ